MASLNTEAILKSEGILQNNEQFETVYLNEDEIEKFMEKYLAENPDAEIETRFISQPPVELTQTVEVKWLRPETPEIPPIIIREVDPQSAPEQQTIKIVERRDPCEDMRREPPMVIREKPPFVVLPEPKIAYVQNVVKKQSSDNYKSIKVERVNSSSESHHNHFSFEEHASVYEDECGGDQQSSGRLVYGSGSVEDEQTLRCYEERLKQTLYEEYLLKMERERLERKLTCSGIFEERLRERSISQDRQSSQVSSRARLSSDNAERQRLQQQQRDQECREYYARTTSSIGGSETGTYRSIKFAKVTYQRELRRLTDILNNPKSLNFKKKSDADKIAQALAEIAEDKQPCPPPPPQPQTQPQTQTQTQTQPQPQPQTQQTAVRTGTGGGSHTPAPRLSYVKTNSSREHLCPEEQRQRQQQQQTNVKVG